jgi:hypothetical protein
LPSEATGLPFSGCWDQIERPIPKASTSAMKTFRFLTLMGLFITVGMIYAAEDSLQKVTEKSFSAPGNTKVTVRMQAPYDAETPLQVVCYFKHKESGDKTLGAAVELDRKLGGIIATLRNGDEFVGNPLEMLLLTPPEGTIKPKRLLLVGLGEESEVSLETLERVGKESLRMASAIGAQQIAFAPLIRDQGNSKFSTGDVGQAVIRGMLLAYDTEQHLQKEKMSKAYSLEAWIEEAGPDYFADTVTGAQKGIAETTARIAARSSGHEASHR